MLIIGSTHHPTIAVIERNHLREASSLGCASEFGQAALSNRSIALHIDWINRPHIPIRRTDKRRHRLLFAHIAVSQRNNAHFVIGVGEAKQNAFRHGELISDPKFRNFYEYSP